MSCECATHCKELLTPHWVYRCQLEAGHEGNHYTVGMGVDIWWYKR